MTAPSWAFHADLTCLEFDDTLRMFHYVRSNKYWKQFTGQSAQSLAANSSDRSFVRSSRCLQIICACRRKNMGNFELDEDLDGDCPRARPTSHGDWKQRRDRQARKHVFT